MRRRDLLRLTGAVGALAVAGCVGGDEDSDGGTTGGGSDEASATPDGTPSPEPEAESDDQPAEESDDDGSDGDAEELGDNEYDHPGEAVEAFIVAWQEGDPEAANAILYEDGELDPIDETPEQMVQDAPELEELESPEIDGDTATVETVLGEPGGDETHPVTFELVLVDGAWEIADLFWAVEDATPEVQFDFDFDDDTMTIVHVAGDAVPADELFVRGDGLGETGVWHELSGDFDADEDVQAGDSLTLDVEDEYSVSLVWDDGEHSATLHSLSGARERESDEERTVDSWLADTDNYDGTVEDFTGQDEVVVKTGELEDAEQVFVYEPPAIRIDEGTEVVWEWVGDGGHTVTHEVEDPEFDSGVISGDGETFSHTFEESGTYFYYCLPHRALAQKGAVVVE